VYCTLPEGYKFTVVINKDVGSIHLELANQHFGYIVHVISLNDNFFSVDTILDTGRPRKSFRKGFGHILQFDSRNGIHTYYNSRCFLFVTDLLLNYHPGFHSLAPFGLDTAAFVLAINVEIFDPFFQVVFIVITIVLVGIIGFSSVFLYKCKE
jgi:hypothetical protein